MLTNGNMENNLKQVLIIYVKCVKTANHTYKHKV